jgi:hypothetical protein
VKVVPLTSPVRATFVVAPLQITPVEGVAKASGVGFTITVAVVAAEAHDPTPEPPVAMMVKLVVCGTKEVLVNVPEMELPVPLAAMPLRLVVLSLDQL